jgi:hypothetical protein
MNMIAEQLMQLRQTWEEQCGEPLRRLDLPPELVLEDVCRALGLGDPERAEVLGYAAATVDEWLASAPYALAEEETLAPARGRRALVEQA